MGAQKDQSPSVAEIEEGTRFRETSADVIFVVKGKHYNKGWWWCEAEAEDEKTGMWAYSEPYILRNRL